MLPLIGITQGESNGIGPEIIQKSLREAAIYKLCRPVVIGDPKLFKISSSKTKQIQFIPVPSECSSIAALSKATDLCLRHALAGIVTAPVDKEKISREMNSTFLGHTEYLAKRCAQYYKKPFHPTMFFVGKKEKLALVTTHLPLKKVSEWLTHSLIKKTILNVHEALQTYFRISHPKLAILGLNPHAGERGLLGNEEKKIITPIVTLLNQKSISVSGPFSADNFFSKLWKNFDATVAIYHDQGLAPFKLRNYLHSVNVTIGLPILRTSVDHGVGYDIAKKGTANHASMMLAIQLAAKMAKKYVNR